MEITDTKKQHYRVVLTTSVPLMLVLVLLGTAGALAMTMVGSELLYLALMFAFVGLIVGAVSSCCACLFASKNPLEPAGLACGAMIVFLLWTTKGLGFTVVDLLIMAIYGAATAMLTVYGALRLSCPIVRSPE